MSKYIYTFNIEKVAKISEKRQEKYTDENGVEKERTITETVEKTIPVEIAIKLPNRKQVQEAEMVYSIEMSKCIKQGILTKTMLLNRHRCNIDKPGTRLDNAFDFCAHCTRANIMSNPYKRRFFDNSCV